MAHSLLLWQSGAGAAARAPVPGSNFPDPAMLRVLGVSLGMQGLSCGSMCVRGGTAGVCSGHGGDFDGAIGRHTGRSEVSAGALWVVAALWAPIVAPRTLLAVRGWSGTAL